MVTCMSRVATAVVVAALTVSVASAQSGRERFRAGGAVVIRWDGSYYLGRVNVVTPEGGCTRVDYSFTASNFSGNGYTYPDCLEPTIFTVAEANARGLPIANAAAGGGAPTQAAPAPQQQTAGGGGVDVQQILDAHNAYRSAVGVQGLSWSSQLAGDAQEWANHLARIGGLQHAGGGDGENLWGGSAGYYSYAQMVDSWGSERQYFRYGTFPDVSTTGNWADVGHYTQIIWRGTSQVGCAKATGPGSDYFVCRYRAAGNVVGSAPY